MNNDTTAVKCIPATQKLVSEVTEARIIKPIYIFAGSYNSSTENTLQTIWQTCSGRLSTSYNNLYHISTESAINWPPILIRQYSLDCLSAGGLTLKKWIFFTSIDSIYHNKERQLFLSIDAANNFTFSPF